MNRNPKTNQTVSLTPDPEALLLGYSGSNPFQHLSFVTYVSKLGLGHFHPSLLRLCPISQTSS